VILVLALSIASTGFKGTPDPSALIAAPAMRPLDVVASSVARGLAGLRSPPTGLSTCDDRRPEIRHAADDLFNVEHMARHALGRHWKALEPDVQGEFIRLFQGVLTQSFVRIVERYSSEDEVAAEEEIVGAFAHVRSRITGDRPESMIEYRLSWSGAQWTVYDIVLDDVSLVSNYRSQLNAIIQASSVGELLEWMRTEPPRCRQSRDLVATTR